MTNKKTKWVPHKYNEKRIRLTLIVEFDDYDDYEKAKETIEYAACSYGSVAGQYLEMEVPV